jgi:hypothetical protein
MHRSLLAEFFYRRGHINRYRLRRSSRTGAESDTGDQSHRGVNRESLPDWPQGHAGAIPNLSLRRGIGLALFVALVVSLFPVSAASAAQSEYGSIAWSRSTGVVAVGFAGSINDAAQAAIGQCQAQSGTSDCAAYGWFYQAYAAFAHGSVTGWGFGWGTGTGYADSYAMQNCQQNSSDNSCQIVLRTQTPEVSGDTPPATGGIFATPITPSPTPTYQPSPTYEPSPTYGSSTPANVSVPNLLGLSLNDARQTLPQGLQLGTVTGSGGTVVGQQPQAGDAIPANTYVNVVLSAPGFPTWLVILLVVLALLGIVTVLITRIFWQRAQRQHWNASIRVKPMPGPNPIIRLREPGKTVRFAVQVEVHSDPGVQTLQEVVTQ